MAFKGPYRLPALAWSHLLQPALPALPCTSWSDPILYLSVLPPAGQRRNCSSLLTRVRQNTAHCAPPSRLPAQHLVTTTGNQSFQNQSINRTVLVGYVDFRVTPSIWKRKTGCAVAQLSPRATQLSPRPRNGSSEPALPLSLEQRAAWSSFHYGNKVPL